MLYSFKYGPLRSGGQDIIVRIPLFYNMLCGPKYGVLYKEIPPYYKEWRKLHGYPVNQPVWYINPIIGWIPAL